MWTVTLLLKPLIVVLHLLGGLTTMALLAWRTAIESTQQKITSPLAEDGR